MYKKVTLCWFLIFCTTTVRAQAPVEKSLLWEISHKDLAAPSYLFGTIHLICQDDFGLSDSLKIAMTLSKQLVLEVDMDDPGLMGAMAKTMHMAGNTTLRNLLGSEDYSRLNRFYKDSLGMDILTLDRAKPFVMMGPLFNKVLNCMPRSYEMELMTLATTQQMDIIGVETIEEQMAIFDSIPYSQQAKMLLTLIDSLPAAKREFADLIQLYKKEDLPALYELTLKSEYGMDGNDELMLYNRNQKWIHSMETYIRGKTSFIAVGAAHLGGDRGVIALLRKKGYSVRAMGK
jgi:uncharacterized protein YbaP (TraB family)